MSFPFNLASFAIKHKRIYLSAVFTVFAVFLLLFSKITFREDISEMLPSNLKEETELFQNSPVSNKIFIVVNSPDAAQSLKSADIISYSFLENGDLGLSFVKADEDFILAYYYNAPYIWNEKLEKKTEALIETDALKKRMEENLKNLSSPAGVFLKDFIVADPIGMVPVLAEELKNLNLSASLTARNGYITSEDGKTVLLIFDHAGNSLDSARAEKINSFFDSVKKELPEDSYAFLMGSVRYTNENNKIIKNDLKRIFAVSSSLMLALFLFFLRTKKAVLIYLVPPVVIAVSAVCVFYVFGGISGITIGFGSVLMGLSIDYSVYMYFAAKASKPKEKFANMKKMITPVATSALTSVLTFSLLFFSPIPLFKQVALFTAGGLLTALFIALCVAPLIFEASGQPEKNFEMKTYFKPFTALIIILLICASGAISLKYIKFNISFDSLNTVSREFEKDKEFFDALTGSSYNNNAYFFIFGENREAALRNNEILSDSNKETLKLASLYPSQKQKEINFSRWKSFWNGERVANVEKEIAKFSKEHGIKAGAFEEFYSFLRTGSSPYGDSFSVNDMYNPMIRYGEGFVFANIIPRGAEIKNDTEIKGIFVSGETLQEKITSSISRNITIIMAVLIICTFLILFLWFKNVQFAVIVLMAPICGVCLFLVLAAVLGIELNLFGLFAAPLLIGLGIDYGIFIIFQQKGEAKLHPTKAVVVAALSTIIGFGSLICAQHKVLFMIGFMVFTGISTAILVSVFLIPSLLKGVKKTVLLLLAVCLVSLSGCATTQVNYTPKEPGPVSFDSPTVMFYGSYMEDLQFRVISVSEKEGYRIVIMSDLGVKLLDMKVAKDGIDMYFCIAYMPKEAIEDFAAFFKEFFIAETKPNIKHVSSRTYYYRSDEPVLWVKQI